jgi:quinol monooxygenase YgiN
MRKLSALSAMAIALALFMASCDNKPKTEETTTTTTSDTTKTTTAPKPVFQPYKAILVVHTVKDFDKWYDVFKASDSLPKSFGLTNPGVGRGLDNDKQVVVFHTAADLAKAKEFTKSPALKATMGKAGVTGPPTISFVDVIMDDTTTIPQHERLMITHKVKDFDAWKKGFDGEGDAARAANGFVLRALARDADDPNTVTILFAITDMAKAKARVASPELKKVMTDAGVTGPPTLTWFKWVNQ